LEQTKKLRAQYALCRAGTESDAETRKIRRVVQPESDDDAANKLYVEQSVKIWRDRQGEIYERLIAFEKNMQTLQTAVNELRRVNHTAEKKNTNSEREVNI